MTTSEIGCLLYENGYKVTSLIPASCVYFDTERIMRIEGERGNYCIHIRGEPDMLETSNDDDNYKEVSVVVLRRREVEGRPFYESLYGGNLDKDNLIQLLKNPHIPRKGMIGFKKTS
jgi:hypothetical protein